MGHILLSFSLRAIRINVYVELVIVKDGGSFYSVLDTEEEIKYKCLGFSYFIY